MILCTGCGTKNPDDARSCSNCGRKLQSRWAMPGGGQQNGEGQGGPGPSLADKLAEPVWQLLQPMMRSHDESAGRLMRSAVEVWFYGLVLIGSALATAFTQEWWWLAGGIGFAALFAWARGI